MSYKIQARDVEPKGDVDFDFFDAPVGETESEREPTRLGQSGKWKKSDTDGSKVNGESDSKSTEDRHSHRSRSPSASGSDSYSSDYSDDDSYSSSDTERSGSKKVIEARIPRVEITKTGDKQNKEKDTSLERPKTSHDDRRHSSSSDYTDTDESDVTDVSPLHSPHNYTEYQHNSKKGGSKEGKPPKTPVHKAKEVTFKRPPSASSTSTVDQKTFLRGTGDNIDLRLLMQAVNEMEWERKMISQQNQEPVFLLPQPTSQSRKNFSFSNDKVNGIDKENQRLMQQIMKCTQKAKKAKRDKQKKESAAIRSKMSSSSINRNQIQQKIEQENFAMLRRLQTTRATSTLAKNHLAKDYKNQFLFGCSVAKAHPEAPRKKTPSPYAVQCPPEFSPSGDLSYSSHNDEDSSQLTGVKKKTRPMSAVPQRTRPLSATSPGRKRPQSAKVHGSPTKTDSRPHWEERW